MTSNSGKLFFQMAETWNHEENSLWNFPIYVWFWGWINIVIKRKNLLAFGYIEIFVSNKSLAVVE